MSEVNLLVLLIVTAVATVFGQGGYGPPPTRQTIYEPTRGYGKGYQPRYYKPHPYNFGYNIKDDYGNQQKRQEAGDSYGNVKGSYGIVDKYGIYRQVDYQADDYGFKAYIKTNEPGTANENPADVRIQADPVIVQYAAAAKGYGGHVTKSRGYPPKKVEPSAGYQEQKTYETRNTYPPTNQQYYPPSRDLY